MIAALTTITPRWVLEKWERYILQDYQRTRHFLSTINPDVLEEISKKKALHIFHQSVKETPAYQSFLSKKHINPQKIKTMHDFDLLIPETDKENYIRSFPFEKRCRDGHLPKHGNIDESGGTSGIATNWIHDFQEESALLKSITFEFNYAFDGDKKDFFVLSAWSTGPWATGVKFCELMERIALVKNTATDPKDIINTLKMFGKKHNYLIGGYPPFVKNLIDDNSDQINWKNYNIDLVIGGEGVTLEWVYYVRNKLKDDARIISSYGASDVDIGVGFETPLSFEIREAVSRDKDLQMAIFGKEEIPMIFQYNPTMHYIRETKGREGKQEFHITLLDPKTALPKLKYNLHDEGRRLSFNEMMSTIKVHKPQLYHHIQESKKEQQKILHLPFLCIFGRSDGTLSFDGANVFPQQIEQGILKDRDLAKKTNRFKIEKKHDQAHNTQFHIHIEMKKNQKINALIKNRYGKIILTELLEVNPDFKESYAKNQKLKPIINLYEFNHHLFKIDETKAKNIYIIKNEK